MTGIYEGLTTDPMSFNFDTTTTMLIMEMAEVFEDVFPGNWDMQAGMSTSTVVFVVKFDDITIENGRSKKHYIKGLLVKFRYDTDTSNFAKPRGVRTTLSDVEIDCSYIHSHLPKRGNTILEYKSFCTGTDSYEMARTMLNNNFSQPTLKMYLLQTIDFLKWESLSGGPYIKIERINSRKVKYNKHLSDIDIYDIRRTIDLYLPIEGFDLEVGSNITVKNNDKLNISLTTAFKKQNLDSFLCVVSENGTEYVLDTMTVELNNNRRIRLGNVVWKNEPVKFKVVSQRTGDINIPHTAQSVVKFAKNYIEDKIKENIFRNEY